MANVVTVALPSVSGYEIDCTWLMFRGLAAYFIHVISDNHSTVLFSLRQLFFFSVGKHVESGASDGVGFVLGMFCFVFQCAS